MDPLSIDEIDQVIQNKEAIYNLNVDKSVNKIGNGSKLEKFELKKLPIYIQNNLNNYRKWID